MAKYQQYAEYKNSGVEWLGEIPSEWDLLRGKWRFKSLKEVNRNLQCMERLALTMRGVIERSIDSDDGLQPLKFSGYQIFEKNDLVFKLIDLENYKTSRVGLVFKKGIMSPAYIRLQPFSSVYPKFFYYLYFDLYLRGIYNEIGGQGVRSALNASDLLELEVCVPNITEQKKIASFLDYEIGKINTLIEKQQTLIQLLKEKRQAVISHAVTPNKDEESAKLGYFIDVLSGYSFPSAGYQAEAKGNTALLRGINVGVGALKWDETVWWSRTDRDGLEAFELEEGDIVFGMDRPWISAGARVAEVTKADLPCLLLQRVIRIRANKNTYQPFIKLCLASKEFKFSVEADLTGVSVPHISPDQVKSFLIRDIGYEQQKLITDNASKEIKVLESIEESAEQAIQLMQERRTALISAAVTGKIDVRGWRAAE